MKMQGNEINLKEALFAFKDLMDAHNIEFILLYGALLGAYRNKRLLPWDVDLDVAILFKSYNDFANTDLFSLLRDAYKRGFRNVRWGHDFNVDNSYIKYPEIAALPEKEQWKEFLRINQEWKYGKIGLYWRSLNPTIELLESTNGWINIDCMVYVKGIYEAYKSYDGRQLGKIELYGTIFNTPPDVLYDLSNYYGKNWKDVFCSYELWIKHQDALREGCIPQEVKDFMDKWSSLLAE